MTVSLNFILGFVMVAVFLLIALMIYSETVSSVETAIDKSITDPTIKEQATEELEQKSKIGWTVIGLLPIILFVVLFRLIGFTKDIDERTGALGDSPPGSPKQTISLPKWLFFEFLWLIGLAKKDDKEDLK